MSNGSIATACAVPTAAANIVPSNGSCLAVGDGGAHSNIDEKFEAATAPSAPTIAAAVRWSLGGLQRSGEHDVSRIALSRDG